MILHHDEWTFAPELAVETVTYLVMEDKKYFRQKIGELVQAFDGDDTKYHLRAENKKVSFSKRANLVTDLWRISCDTKPLQNRIMSRLEHIARESEETQHMLEMLETYFRALIQKSQLSLVNEDVGPTALLKLAGFHIEDEQKDAVLRLLDYIRALREYMEIDLFVLINLNACLAKEERRCFFNNCRKEQIRLLCIESAYPPTERLAAEEERVYLIDKDLCEIRK